MDLLLMKWPLLSLDILLSGHCFVNCLEKLSGPLV